MSSLSSLWLPFGSQFLSFPHIAMSSPDPFSRLQIIIQGPDECLRVNGPPGVASSWVWTFFHLWTREAFLWMPRNQNNKYSFGLMEQNVMWENKSKLKLKLGKELRPSILHWLPNNFCLNRLVKVGKIGKGVKSYSQKKSGEESSSTSGGVWSRDRLWTGSFPCPRWSLQRLFI